MKIGNFTLSFVDLAIPLSGLDVEIVRTYDSRQRQMQGDFGQGWTLDIRQGSYRNNRPPGDGWQIQTGFLPCDTIRETKSHLTTVRLSDRELYRFALRLVDGATTAGGCFARAVFEYVDGPLPGSTLEILGSDTVFYANGSDVAVDPDTQEPFVPEDVRLTTRDGRIFELDLAAGVTKVEDLNGNRIEITPAGITHSSGVGIDFERDGAGRITKITDPLGGEILYSYTAVGDLESVTDRVGNTTRFGYSSQVSHLLEEIEDPRGVRPIRNDYDQDGRLIRHTDAFGKSIELGHDLGNRREVVTDRLGHSSVLEYDARGNVVRETDPLGAVTERTFDVEDNLLAEKDPLDHTTSYSYSSSNDLLGSTDRLGNTTAYTYNERGQILTVTDARGKVTTNLYDASGNLLQTTDPAGAVTRFTYDAAGNRLTETDAAGQVTTFEFNGRGNLTREVDALGVATSFTYDGNGNRLTESTTRTLPDGSTETLATSFAYDDAGRVTATTRPDGSTTATGYDTLGQVTSTTDPLGRTTSFSYDLLGRQTETNFPDGTGESRAYDAAGRLTAVTDRAGRVTSYLYDPAGQLLETTFADGSSVASSYDAAGRLVATTDARSNTTGYQYDAAGRRTGVTDALGGTTVFAYDAAGNQVAVTDANGETTQFEYDDADRLVTTVFPDGTQRAVGYDALGRRVSETDQAGLVTRFGYDPLSRLITVTDALGQVTTYGYDEQGNRLTQTDANGHTTRFEFDALGRQTARVLPDGSRETMAYDAAGNLTASTDFLGRTTSYGYDAADRLVSESLPGGSTVGTSYTANGRRAAVTDGRGTTSYSYDERDRLVELACPDGRKLTYGYDAAGNRTRLTAEVASQQLTTSYSYDALNRLATVTDPEGRVYSHGYDAVGNRSSLGYPNGVETHYSYDSLNRLTNLTTTTSVGEVVQSYAYTLGPSGNRTRIDEHDGRSRSYGYDPLYRLTSETVADAAGTVYAKSFAYDPVGNRLSQVTTGAEAGTVSYGYDDRDRLLTEAGQPYSWDANGNLTGKSGEATYAWDPEDRLESVTLADGTHVAYGYDADGVLVRTVTTAPDGSSETVDYLVDTSGPLSQVVAETDGSGNLTAYYLRGDDLLAVLRPGSGARFYHADGLGSIRALTDETEAVTDRWSFTAFGELLEHEGTDENAYLFAGEPLDPNSGFYYNRARWMDPSVGRFSSSDILSGVEFTPATLHKYLYANGDPANKSDPSGLIASLSLGITSVIRGLTIAAIITGGLLALAFLQRGLNQLGGVDTLVLDFTNLDFGSLFDAFGGNTARAEIIAETIARVRQLYSEPGWRLRVIDSASEVGANEVHKTVKFVAPSWFYEYNVFGAGVYPFVGSTAYVFADQVRDLSTPGSRADLSRRLGNVATHEAAHAMGRWGHTPDGPWIMQEGVTGYDSFTSEIRWDPTSRRFLDGVLRD
jgi:RHS repeat-associated protein